MPKAPPTYHLMIVSCIQSGNMRLNHLRAIGKIWIKRPLISIRGVGSIAAIVFSILLQSVTKTLI